MNQMIQYLTFMLLFSTSMSGCNLFNTDPFVDAHRDDEGNVILEDTPKNWEFFAWSVDTRVAREMAGRRPEAGSKTWNEYWLRRLEILPAKRENRQKYINYMIERRRQEGLPELDVWQGFVDSVEPRIAEEVAGGALPNVRQINTWNGYWLWKLQGWERLLHSMPNNRETIEKYASYIIERRRQAGLPELEGYSE